MIQKPVVQRVSSRPQVKRMSLRELQETRSNYDFDYPSSTSTNRWLNRTQSQVVPEAYNPWRPMEEPPKMPANNDKDKCFINQGWFWFFGAIFCLILLIAIVAVVLGIVLPMTTTASPDSNTSPRMVYINSTSSPEIICSTDERGSIGVLNGSIPSGWTLYTFNYSATETTPTLLFGFETDGTHAFYLDTVSITDNNGPSIELLINPSFESSTVNPTYWTQSCQTTCSSQIVSGAQCYEASGNCLLASCTLGVNSSVAFLSQGFTATIGTVYTISFMLNHLANSTMSVGLFYIDVI